MTEPSNNMRQRKIAARDIMRLFSGKLSERQEQQIGDRQTNNQTYQVEFLSTLHALSAMEALAERPGFQSVLTEADRATAHRPRRGMAAAASLLIAVIAGLAAYIGADKTGMFTDQADDGGIQRHLTRTGEQKNIDLPDGSAITLNTASEILVDITGHYRRVTLQRGEAWFDVAKDPERPFSVDVGSRSVSVLGTQFNIRKTPDQFTLAVVEGSVALHKKEEQVDPTAPLLTSDDDQPVVLHPSIQQRLTAGWVINYDAEQNKLTGFTSKNLDSVQNWRTGLLSFEGVSLYKVVQELNRYSAKKILIEDANIINMEIFAAIKVDGITSAIAGLEVTHPLKVTHYFDRIVLTGKE